MYLVNEQNGGAATLFLIAFSLLAGAREDVGAREKGGGAGGVVRCGRGRFGARAMPWASGQASSQVVRIACPELVASCTRCERFAEGRRVWFRWFSVKDLL